MSDPIFAVRDAALDDLRAPLRNPRLTNTVGSWFLPYVEYEPGSDDSVTEPTGVTIFPRDLVPAPRQFVERFVPLVRWTELPAGGHFPAWEEPEAFARELTVLIRDVVCQVSHG
jgi:pimeloyl-ACP methyl ester carboxylesterase